MKADACLYSIVDSLGFHLESRRYHVIIIGGE